MSGTAANVRLLDSSNFQSFRSARRNRYIGGHATRSPVRLQVPHSGHWYVTVDLGGHSGSVRSGVRVLPGRLPALQEAPLSSVPSNRDAGERHERSRELMGRAAQRLTLRRPPVLARRGAALSSRLRHPQARRRGCYHVIHVSFLSRLRTEFRGKVSVTSFKMQHMIDRQTTTRAKESNKSVKPRGSTLGETKGNR